MAARPPRNNDDDPETIEFGIAAVDARITEAGVSFPATDEEILEAIGGGPVPYNGHGNTIRMETALEELDQREFRSEQELLNALYPIFEERRNATSIGLFAQLRSMLPF